MRFKGIYKDKSVFVKILILFLLMTFSVVAHQLLAVIFIKLFTQDGMQLIQNNDLSSEVTVNYLKIVQLFSGIGLFITPTFLFGYLTNFNFRFYKINRQAALLVIAIMMLITPFIGILLEWNMGIDLPEWMLKFDINSDKIVEAFLRMNNIWTLIFTIVVVAVVPAIGEELFFRGYVQQEILRWSGNIHFTILITAFFFSAIHFHFSGMVPRFILGILLGYIFYWSGSLWLPILAHFVNNAQTIILSYLSLNFHKQIPKPISEVNIDQNLALISFVSVTLLLYLLFKNTDIRSEN
tara:strand:- start:8535 stop:9419 length:885 start_codon:yes stop_codon:yes gene_type:complete